MSKKNILENKVIKKVTGIYGFSALLPLLAIVLFLSIFTNNFLATDNIMQVLRQASVYAIMAVGMTFVLITGGTDLSQGSSLALCCVTGCLTINATGNMWLGILVSVLTGAVVGTLNGTVIAYVKIPPFIMTLGSMYMVRGFTLYITNSTQVSVKHDNFKFLGQGFIGGIPVPVYIFLFVGLIAHIILNHTTTGRYIFAIGSNEATSKLSGVKVEKNLIKAYIISGICVGIAAVVYLSRLSAAQPTAGQSYEMEAIAATVIGGTSISGGEGGIFGTLIGAIIIAVIRNGLVLLGVGSFFTQIVLGLIIVGAVSLDVVRRRMAVNK